MLPGVKAEASIRQLQEAGTSTLQQGAVPAFCFFSPAFIAGRPALVAPWLLLASALAQAEPWSGQPRDDIAVVVVTWALAVSQASMLGISAAALIGQRQLANPRFIAASAGFTVAFLLVAKALGIIDILQQLVSLVLHLIF